MGLRDKLRKPILFVLILALVGANLACGISVNLPARKTPMGSALGLNPESSPTSSPSPTLSPSPTVAPTLTRVPPTRTTNPTATTAPTHTPTPRPASSPKQLAVLKEIWETVQENYLYRDFNGLDWEAVYEEYRQKIEAGMSDEDFYLAMDEMIYSLGDDHSVYLSPEEAKQEDQDFSGHYDYAGIGVLTLPVPERKRVTVILVFPDSPAEQAGIKMHDSILEVDGEAILDGDLDQRSNLRGPVGSSVTILVQSPGGEPRQVKLVRRQIASEMPVPHEILTSPDGKQIGYLLLTTFNDETIPGKVRAAMKEMREQGRLDGLILDNRQNGGGANTVFEDVMAYFEDGKLGYFVSREKKAPLYVDGRNIEGSQKLPVVVLVGPGTASFGEIFSGILKDTKRAYIIGQTTDGNVEILYIYEFSDSSRAWLAHDTFQPLNHPEQNWEASGIIPDLEVSSNWDEVSQETDPVIQAALKYFDQR